MLLHLCFAARDRWRTPRRLRPRLHRRRRLALHHWRTPRIVLHPCVAARDRWRTPRRLQPRLQRRRRLGLHRWRTARQRKGINMIGNRVLNRGHTLALGPGIIVVPSRYRRAVFAAIAPPTVHHDAHRRTCPLCRAPRSAGSGLFAHRAILHLAASHGCKPQKVLTQPGLLVSRPPHR